MYRRQIRGHSLGHHGGEVPSSERRRTQVFIITFSVAHPDPQDPYVWASWVPYGSGSGSFCNQAKIVRKTIIPTVLRLQLQKVISKKVPGARSGVGSRSISQRYGSADPDPESDPYVPECHGSATVLTVHKCVHTQWSCLYLS